MKRKIVLFVLLLAALPFPLWGQTDTSENIETLLTLPLEELLNIDINITTASQKDEKLNQAPATVYVVTQKEIQQRGYVYLKDVLRDLPGMETIENYFSEQGTLVPVRGVIGNNKIIILVNGVRVNPPGGEEMMLRDDFNVLGAKQIEVIYGLGGTLYGQDAINAVINIITPQPQQKAAIDAMVRGGMYNTKEGVVSFSQRISPANARYLALTASLSFSDNQLSRLDKEYPDWWNANYTPVITKTGIDPVPTRFDKGFNPFIRLEGVNSAFQIWHRESSRSSAEGGYAPILQYAPEAVWHDRTTVISATHKFTVNDKVKINSSLAYNRYEIDPETRYVFPNDTGIFLNDFKYGIGTGLRVDERVEYTVNKKFSVQVGGLAAFYNIIPKASFPGGVQLNKDLKSQGGNFIYYTRKGDSTSKVELPRSYDLIYNNYGAYAEGQYLFSERLKAVLGFRADVDTRYKEVPLSPRLSVIYCVNSKVTIKYIYNKGFVQPAPYFGYNVFDNGQNLNTFNANLQAEHASSNEVNITYLDKKGLMLTSAMYYNTQKNLIIVEDGRINPPNLVKDSVWLNPDGTGLRELTRTANSGNTEALGIDLFGSYKSEHLSWWASFSYVYFKQVLNTMISHLDNISPVNVRAGVTWQIIKKLSATPSIIFRSTPQDMTQTQGLGSEIINPYSVNLHINYLALRGLTIFFDGTNMTDHRYALKGVITPTPQEPIRVLLGARYTLP
jgi:outer membrane cobalamin receptor